MGARQKRIVPALHTGWRVDGVEHVAGNQQDVCLKLDKLFKQPVQKTPVFILTVIAVEGLAKVPICCVNNFKHGLRKIEGTSMDYYVFTPNCNAAIPADDPSVLPIRM